MNIYTFLEKRAATLGGLQKAFTATVKPFASKGLPGQNFMTRPAGTTVGGKITLSGEGITRGGAQFPVGSGLNAGKLHKARNLVTGLHEGRERASTVAGGFSGHNQATTPMEDLLQINTLSEFTPVEKAVLRDGLPDKAGRPATYGLQRRAEAKVLGEQLPKYKPTFDALVEGKTHRPDGVRLLNRHEKKKINRDYEQLQETRKLLPDPADVASQERLRANLPNLENRLEKLTRSKRKSIRNNAYALWDRLEARAQRPPRVLGVTDFRPEIRKAVDQLRASGVNTY